MDGKFRFTINGLGLKPGSKRKFLSESGWPSVGVEALKELRRRREGAASMVVGQLVARNVPQEEAEKVSESLARLIDVKSKRSLVSGFVKPLLTRSSHSGEAADSTFGRVHASMAFDTSTGRLACRHPNLQNLPVTGLRRAFRPATGNKLIVADYSQLELRVLAHIAQCPSMIEQLMRGGDFHSETAAQMFPEVAAAVLSGDAVIEKDDSGAPTVKSKFGNARGKAKAVNFGIIYGKEAASLAEDLDISPKEAEDLINTWYACKPEVLEWKQRLVREAKVDLHTKSLLGRWRTLPLLDAKVGASYYCKSKSERAAVNFGIQGSAADIVLAAMLQIWRNRELANLGFQLVLQVHDEFVLEGPEAEAEQAKCLVKSMMMNPFAHHHPDYEFSVPLEVDVGIGDSLEDGKV